MKIKHLASSSSGNAHLLDDTVLLDAGLSVKKLRKQVDLRAIEFVLLSHEHGDHSKSVPDLLRSAVPVYTSRGSAEALGIDSHHRTTMVDSVRWHRKGDWKFMALDNVHDAEEPYSYLINKGSNRLLYMTDTAYSKYNFSGLTHILIECNYSREIVKENIAEGSVPEAQLKRLVQTHFGLEDVLEFLAASDLSKVREIHLLHLSDRNSDAEKFERAVQSMTGIPTIIAEHGGRK